jgi:hypothetical protein
MEKGISLYLAVVIISILLAIVLGLGAILFYQLQMTKEIGNSVVAFYGADTGIERALYDEINCFRQTDIFNCPLYGCSPDNNGDGYCDGVEENYDTGEIVLDNGAKYQVQSTDIPVRTFYSKGIFRETSRAIEIRLFP